MSQLRTNSIVPVGGIPAGADGGGIIQVVQTVKTDDASTTSNSYTDITGLSVTITPRSTSNKILIMMNVNIGHSTNATTGFRIIRGASTDIASGTYAGSGYSAATVGGRISVSDDGNLFAFSMQYLDSPATTSATTYKIQWATQSATAYINRAASSTGGGFSRCTSISTLLAVEVSG